MADSEFRSASHPPPTSAPAVQAQGQGRPHRTSSAFSRLANLALSSSSGSASSSSPASASVPSSSAGPSRNALDVLENIANADQGRLRPSSIETALSGAGGNAGPPRADRRRAGSANARSWYARDSSESRSRDRSLNRGGEQIPAMSVLGGPGGLEGRGGVDSPGNMYRHEVLPPNASYSAFSSFSSNPNDSHFFPPGASGFSFEASPASGSIWDGSFRSSATGSPSLFEDQRAPSISVRQATTEMSPLNPRTVSSDGSGPSSGSQGGPHPVQLWDLPQAASSRVYGPSAVRTSSPVGGGRKPKEASRRLRFTVATPARDKSLVGLAKPPRGSAEHEGRVAVAGKACLKLLSVPHGASSRSASTTTPSTAVPTPSSSYRASSIAYRRSRSRGSPAPGSIRDGSVGRIDEEKEDEQRESVSEVMDVRVGSRLGPAYLFSDVRWGYGGTSSLSSACARDQAGADPVGILLQPPRTSSRRALPTARSSCGTSPRRAARASSSSSTSTTGPSTASSLVGRQATG